MKTNGPICAKAIRDFRKRFAKSLKKFSVREIKDLIESGRR